MKKMLAIILLVITTACGVIDNPYALRAAADAQIKATNDAISERVMVATLNAEETKSAVAIEKEHLQIYAQATREALNFEQTKIAATAQAKQTATAIPLTATPLAATQMAIVQEVEKAERRAYWGQFTDPLIVLMPTLLLFVALGLLIIGAVVAFRRLLPIIETRGRAFTRGQQDAPLFVLGSEERVIIIDPDRNFGPALLVSPGKAESSGNAPTFELQERVTARDQTIDLARSVPQRRMPTYKAVPEQAEPLQQLPASTEPKIEIIELEAVPGWISEVERKLLVNGDET